MAKAVFALMLALYAPLARASAEPKLDRDQSRAFRSWFVKIVREQLNKGRDPRWNHRDCAGLVRFAAYEAMRQHNEAWFHSAGISKAALPPEVDLKGAQKQLLNLWQQTDGKKRSSFAPAIGIVQNNSVFVSKDINQARPGDLIFFDQGDDQHLMIWMGQYIAYHRGIETKTDNGLRALSWEQLFNQQDSRWQTRDENPNFIGIFRFSFLSS